jgi:hypothetical protein
MMTSEDSDFKDFRSFYVITVRDPLMPVPCNFTVTNTSADNIRNLFRKQWKAAMEAGEVRFTVYGVGFAEPKLYMRKVPWPALTARNGDILLKPKDVLPIGTEIWKDPEDVLWIFKDSMVDVVPLWTWVHERRVDIVSYLNVEDIPEGMSYPDRQIHINIVPPNTPNAIVTAGDL